MTQVVGVVIAHVYTHLTLSDLSSQGRGDCTLETTLHILLDECPVESV